MTPNDTANRDAKGRFGAGNKANTKGNPKPTPEQRLEQLLQRHSNDLLDAAFREALAGDNAVLAALLNFLAATVGATTADDLRAAALIAQPAPANSH